EHQGKRTIILIGNSQQKELRQIIGVVQLVEHRPPDPSVVGSIKDINGKVMIDQIQCVDKERIGDKIKNLTVEEMNKVAEKLRKILSLRELLKAKL
ncbi:8325_t:CDS:2, partial [Funneliformis geosporum]